MQCTLSQSSANTLNLIDKNTVTDMYYFLSFKVHACWNVRLSSPKSYLPAVEVVICLKLNYLLANFID